MAVLIEGVTPTGIVYSGANASVLGDNLLSGPWTYTALANVGLSLDTATCDGGGPADTQGSWSVMGG